MNCRDSEMDEVVQANRENLINCGQTCLERITDERLIDEMPREIRYPNFSHCFYDYKHIKTNNLRKTSDLNLHFQTSSMA